MGTSRVLIATAALVCVLTARPTLADSWSPPPTDTQAVELSRLKLEKQSQFEDPVTKRRWGRAEVLVNAPAAVVRAAVMDYGNYSNFIHRFQKSKILKREADTADVYLQLSILKGAATLWTVQHFTTPQVDGRGEKLSGTMVKGNMADLQTVWHWRAVDEQHTIVTLEITGVPHIPLPTSLITQQLQEACGEGVLDLRTHVETQLGYRRPG